MGEAGVYRPSSDDAPADSLMAARWSKNRQFMGGESGLWRGCVLKYARIG